MSDDNFTEQTSAAGGSNTDTEPNSRQRTNNSQTAETGERVFQTTLEYWKVQYDFYKHLMTIALALLAAFGAMLGGVLVTLVVQLCWIRKPDL